MSEMGVWAMRVAAVGDNCVDAYAHLSKSYPGGNPVNVAVYLRRLGMDASYTGVVGNDAYGYLMKNALHAKGVDISHLHTRHGRTAVTQVELVGAERVFGDYDEGVMADFKLTEADVEFLCRHDLIHTGIWGKIERDLGRLQQRGMRISFDFADKLDHEVVGIALPHVDYAFFSYTHEDEFIRSYLQQAQQAGPRVAVATLGENGSLAYDGHTFARFGIVPVDVVDTMGAGDSFIAGFLRAALYGEQLGNCLKAGAENAAVTLQYMGAWELEANTKQVLDAAAIGDNCMDVYPALGTAYPTGNVVDFAIHLRQLGVPVSVISTTGEDDYGRQMVDALRGEDLDLSHFHTAPGLTAVTYMELEGNERIHGEYAEGVLETMVFSKDDLDFAARHTLVHSAFWGKAHEHLADLHAHGAVVSFDYATKMDDALVPQTLPWVDYAFFSMRCTPEEAQAPLRRLHGLGAGVVVATLGEQGSVAFDGKDFYTFGIDPVEVVNTVGAGDAFIAGFMAGVLRGESLEDCLNSGAKTASSILGIFEPWRKTR